MGGARQGAGWPGLVWASATQSIRLTSGSPLHVLLLLLLFVLILAMAPVLAAASAGAASAAAGAGGRAAPAGGAGRATGPGLVRPENETVWHGYRRDEIGGV